MPNIMEYHIVMLVSENPKKPGSKARARFDHYKTGMTRDQALKAGLTGGDIRWDTKHGFIKLLSPAQYKAYKARKGTKGKGKAKAKPTTANPVALTVTTQRPAIPPAILNATE